VEVITRRRFARDLGTIALVGRAQFGELLLSDHAVERLSHQDVIWLDANENPAGPPPLALSAIVNGAADVSRYHFDEFATFTEAIAASEKMRPEQVLFGIGSAEVINAAICAFTSSSRPLITATPTYEVPLEFARLLGKSVVELRLNEDWTFPLSASVQEAAKADGGLIYLCNPNNPTSTCTSPKDLRWLAHNLPPNTILLVDEAYIHFAEPNEVESALSFVRDNGNVVVTRTFSKIYGMAGVRAGFGCAKPELIKEMSHFRSNVIPVLALRAATAALHESPTLIPTRRAKVAIIRNELCDWLRQKDIRYVEPHANFVMIAIRGEAGSFGAEMFRRGVAVGRPFRAVSRMLRVTIGTDQEMKRFRDVFWEVYNA
jgi:histidinol-phosphate aminotransferase